MIAKGDVPIFVNGAANTVFINVKISPNVVNVNSHFTINVNVKIIIATKVGDNESETIGGTDSGNFIDILSFNHTYNPDTIKLNVIAIKIPSLPKYEVSIEYIVARSSTKTFNGINDKNTAKEITATTIPL